MESERSDLPHVGGEGNGKGNRAEPRSYSLVGDIHLRDPIRQDRYVSRRLTSLPALNRTPGVFSCMPIPPSSLSVRLPFAHPFAFCTFRRSAVPILPVSAGPLGLAARVAVIYALT